MSAERISPNAANVRAEKKQAAGGFTADSTEPISGMERRRDAAFRLPPLPSGPRDPLFDWERPARPSVSSGAHRPPIRVEFDTPHNVALIRGFKGGELCRQVGGRGLWIQSRRGWSTSVRTARDVIAAAERDGRPVIITEAGGGR